MKRISFILLSFFILQQISAQVKDTAIKVYSNFVCECIDTLNLDQPEEKLRKEFSTCKTIGLTVLLNAQLAGVELMTDEKQMEAFEKRSLTYLLNNCEAVQRLAKALANEPEYEENNDPKIFTPVSFFDKYELVAGEKNNLLHVYNNFGSAEKPSKFQRVVDIRWTFKTEEDAMKWHQLNLRKNAEEGAPVTDKIIIPGTKGLKVYREGNAALQSFEMFGIKQRHHYFIFVYKNIVCKVFIATDEKTTTAETVPFAEAAVKQLEAVLK